MSREYDRPPMSLSFHPPVTTSFFPNDLINCDLLPRPTEVKEEEYSQFYKSLTKDSAAPMSRAHFVAEGEVTFRALLFVPRVQPSDSFNRYGTKTDNIKLYVRRVFITDEFNELMPNYLAFIQVSRFRSTDPIAMNSLALVM